MQMLQCSECESKFFTELYAVQFQSKLENINLTEDAITPVPVLICANCGTVFNAEKAIQKSFQNKDNFTLVKNKENPIIT